MTTPAFLELLRQHVSAEAYRQLAPDDLWLRFRDALDETAFRVLLERFGSRVYQRCRAILRDDHLAEEAFQDTFRDLIRKRDRIPTYRSASAWAYQTATNHAKYLRRRQRRWWHGSYPEPAAELESSDDAEAMGRLMAGLPDRYRRPLELVYWDGLTHAETATVLGWSKGRVDVSVARGLTRLKSQAARLGLPAAVVSTDAVLAKPVAALSDAVLAKVLNQVWPEGGPVVIVGPWWGMGWTKAAVALAVFGTAAAAGVWWGTADRAPTPPALTAPPAANPPVESLQARNIRIVRDDLVAALQVNLQKFYPPDNQVQLASIRAFGSEVEVEFRATHPPLPATGVAAGLRGRYCTYRRRLIVQIQPAGQDRWYQVNPEKPALIDIPAPFGIGAQVVRGREDFAAAQRLFDELPRDERAEGELLTHLFGPPGGELLLPAWTRGVSGFAGGMILQAGDGALFARDRPGRWRYAGECPGWFPVVVGDRVYCSGHDVIRSRPLAEPLAARELLCPEPPMNRGEKAVQLFVVGDWLYQAVNPHVHCIRPLANPSAGWTRIDTPAGFAPNGLAVSDGTLFGNDERLMYARPAADVGAAWKPVGPWPGGPVLVADGDRLLAFGEIGPIYARPAAAGPWKVVGRVHDPYKR